MAKRNNNSSDSEKDLPKAELNNASVPENEKSIEDKLTAAAGSINRAEDDSKVRDDMLAKQRKIDAKEKRAQDAEKEKQRRAAEKEALATKSAKLAELEYAESYRKKLQKEKQKNEEERKLREKEIKDAEKKAAEEASAKRIAEILEADRAEAQRRSERAAAVLNMVNNRDSEGTASESPTVDADQGRESLDNAVQRAIREAEEKDAEAGSKIEKDDGTTDAPQQLDEAGQNPEPAEPILDNEEDADDGKVIVQFGEGTDATPIINIVYSDEQESDEDEAAEEEQTDDDSEEDILGDVEKWFEDPDGTKRGRSGGNANGIGTDDDSDDIDPLDEIPSFNSRNSGNRGEMPGPEDKLDSLRDKNGRISRKREKDLDDESVSDDFFEQNDIVDDIRAEGKLLKNKKPLHKSYADNSRKAIRDFTRALKEGRRSLASNRDESQSPEIIINLIKITGKIVEIRCDNLENYVRTKSSSYIKDAKLALRKDVNEYNELAAMYSALTGEQLTRLSTFLPDHIASGKALAVIPTYSFNESYVQIYPDENGNLPNEEGAALTKVSPPTTADAVFGNFGAPKSVLAYGGYIKQAKKAIKLLDGHAKRIKKTIAKTNAAECNYKNALRSIKEEKDSGRQNADGYRSAMFELRFKYGKKLTCMKTSRIRYTFAKTKVRLLAGCFAIEREKLKVAYRLLRDIYTKGKPSHRAKAERLFMDSLESYNKYAKRCEKNTKAKIDLLKPNLLGEICKHDKELILPVIAYKRKLVETVGETSRPISMALKELPESNEKACFESSRMIFNGTKIVRDRTSLLDDAPIVDRASSIAKLLLDMLKEYADSVDSLDEFELYIEKSKRTLKYFKKSLKRTEVAISKAFDENGVVTALVENLRVISNVIEVRRINIELARRLKRKEFGRTEGRALYKDIELYNGRAIDYMSIVGEQFTRIANAPINVLAESADKLRVPSIAYKDNYIEVFPKDPLVEPLHEKPVQRRGGYYRV